MEWDPKPVPAKGSSGMWKRGASVALLDSNCAPEGTHTVLNGPGSSWWILNTTKVCVLYLKKKIEAPKAAFLPVALDLAQEWGAEADHAWERKGGLRQTHGQTGGQEAQVQQGARRDGPGRWGQRSRAWAGACTALLSHGRWQHRYPSGLKYNMWSLSLFSLNCPLTPQLQGAR